MNSIKFSEKDSQTIARLSDESLGQLTRALFRKFVLKEDADASTLGEAAGLAFDVICHRADVAAKRAAAGRRSAEKRGGSVPGKAATEPVAPVVPVITIAETLPAEAVPAKRAAPAKRAVPAIDSAEVERRFQKFYDAYPRHVGRAVALKSFARINPDDILLEKMLGAVSVQKTTPQWTKDGGQFIPHPATWLNQHRWEDEVTTFTPTRQVTAQQYEQRDYTGVQAEMLERQRIEIEAKLRAKQQGKRVLAQMYEQRDYSGVQDELMREQDAEMEAFMAKQREEEQHGKAEAV